jgi:hypothetical protein
VVYTVPKSCLGVANDAVKVEKGSTDTSHSAITLNASPWRKVIHMPSVCGRTLMTIVLGLLVAGCGFGPSTGWVVGSGYHRSEQALAPKAPPNTVEVTSGAGTTLRFGDFSESMALSDIQSIQATRYIQWWIPIATVPTLKGTQDRVFGVATIQLPAGMFWVSGRHTASAPGPVLTFAFNVPIPAESSHGAVTTLLAPLRVLVIRATTPQNTKETLTAVLGVGHQFRWSQPRRIPPASLTAISSMREGNWFDFSPGNGGTSNRGRQTHEVNFLHGGIQALVRIIYQLDFTVTNPLGVVVYDKGSQWGDLYMEPGLVPQGS